MRTPHKLLIIAVGLLLFIVLSLSLPLAAQSSFATNTPAPTREPGAFTTNTPIPTREPAAFATNTVIPTMTPLGPAASQFNYALRLWFERDLLDVLVEQLESLEADDVDAMNAVALTQYELQRRFPGAPHDIEQRERVLQAMLNTPRGMVDMRAIVRATIEDALNNGDIVPPSSEYAGFLIEVSSATIDGRDAMDAVVHILYPANATAASQVLYEEFLMALRDDDGRYTLIISQPDLPAAPYEGIQLVRFDRLGDVNRDTLDELVLIINDGQVNERLLVLNYRNGISVDLTAPRQPIRLGSLVRWETGIESRNAPPIEVLQFRQESDVWGCLSELAVTWNYVNNRYQPTTALNSSYENQDSLACRLHENEPIFALTPLDAIGVVQGALDRYGLEAQGAERAIMVLAMLHALNGDPIRAMDTAQSIAPVDGDTESWIGNQTMTFITLIGQSGSSALDICNALATVSVNGACDVDAVLGRIFNLTTFPAEVPILEQLERMGLAAVESTTISQVGRVDRTAVQFNLAASWWAFAPRNGEFVGESIDTPDGFEDAPTMTELVAMPTADGVYMALVDENDVTGALAMIASLREDTPRLSPAIRYAEALSYDLISDRERARTRFYELWADAPDTIWGQLAGDHLEQR